MSDLTNIETVAGCPFCGETPTVEPWHGGGHDKHMVACGNDACPATPAVSGNTRADAIRRWNTRDAKTQDVAPDGWLDIMHLLEVVTAIEQINAKCQTREQRAALNVGRAALAALQRLERDVRVGDGNGDTKKREGDQ